MFSLATLFFIKECIAQSNCVRHYSLVPSSGQGDLKSQRGFFYWVAQEKLFDLQVKKFDHISPKLQELNWLF